LATKQQTIDHESIQIIDETCLIEKDDCSGDCHCSEDIGWYAWTAAEKFEQMGVKKVTIPAEQRYLSFALDNGESYIVDTKGYCFADNALLYKKGKKPISLSTFNLGYSNDEQEWEKIANYLEILPQTHFTVDSPDEFINAIGSDRIIQLKSTIHISDIFSTKKGLNHRFEAVFDGYELTIVGVSNLKIEGLGNKPVEIITKPQYGNVLTFKNCNNITIENIEAGHGPEKGYCTGGVFNFVDSKNITINKSIMYGSGIEGITAENTTDLKCNNSIIRECTYCIMTLKNCNDFEFTNCEFTDNQEFDLVNLSDCNNTIFNTCKFANNRTGTEDYSDFAFFNVHNSSSIILKDCLIENNVANYFCRNKNSIELHDTKIKNNSFTKD
jgi:hypothetical protein